MADLPDISTDPNVALPNVPTDSDVVPYRLGRTDPSGAQSITTGYGPRARPMAAAGGAPDLGPVMAEAFKQLPVDQAIAAIEMASKYIAQRGYQRDLAGGMNAAQAFAKWGPMLFKSGTGVPEAIQRSVPPPISPQQLIQNRLAQQRRDDQVAQFAMRQKATAATEAERTRRDKALEAEKQAKESPEAQSKLAQSKMFEKSLGDLHSARAKLLAEGAEASDPRFSKIDAEISNTFKALTDLYKTKPASTSSKVEQANALRVKHPDWTRDQIIDAIKSGKDVE